MTRGMNVAHAPSRRRGARCSACGARVTSAATWCSLCFTDLTPTPVASAEVAAPATTRADAGAATDTAEAERLAEQMLAELAASAPPTQLTPAFLSGTGGRTVATVLGVVAMAALGFGLLALGGALL